jgi:hypothetical protein
MTQAQSIYSEAKKLMISEAKEYKRQFGNDYPMRRELINNQADQHWKQFDFYRLREVISDKQYTQFCNWIDATACNLHPRNK